MMNDQWTIAEWGFMRSKLDELGRERMERLAEAIGLESPEPHDPSELIAIFYSLPKEYLIEKYALVCRSATLHQERSPICSS